ncbi:MAG TPA: penicillin-binding transpeptidase domain-containing protein, partial [Candidatus Saccharimonadales bacterium]|nr:penicillin-binding transpeptidase domain-containing protein [Candidatus Saccharimonadales bacterium]
KNLTLAQAAMLAAIPQSPTYYSPYGSTQFNPDAGNSFSASALLDRQHYILDQMAKQKMITQAEADAAKKVDILAQVHPLQSKFQNVKAPYFVQAAQQQLIQQFGSSTVQRGGWNVITTVDMTAQNNAEKLVADNDRNVTSRSAGKADDQALIAEDVQTGQIVALVGGEDYSRPGYGQLNFAATQLVSPGSTFKPYDYVTLINNNNNVGAGSVLYDSQGALPGYPCTDKGLPPPKGSGNCLEDYDFIYPGPITLRYALGGSRNVPAVKAMLSAVPNDSSPDKVSSINKVIATASAMMDNPYAQAKHQNTYNCYDGKGYEVSNQIQCYGASAIGDGALLLDDQLNGLSTLARLGKAIPYTFILKITDANSKPVYQWTQPTGTQVVKADAAYIVDNMAADPNASYLPGSCSNTSCTTLAQGGYKFHRYQGWNFAIKTGTNNDGFEGLMASWSPKYAVISWVGNHTRNVDLSSTTMEYMTEPLTRGLMEDLHNGLKPQNWTQPSDIKTAPAFVVRNHIHYGDIEPSPANDLYPSWYAGGSGNKATSQTTDKVSGKLATACTPAAAKEVIANGNASYWNADIFMGGYATVGSNTSSGTSGSGAVDDIHNCDDQPPTPSVTVASDTSNTPDACDPTCTVTVTVSKGTHPLSGGSYTASPAGTVTVTLDGQTINTQAIPSDQSDLYTYSFTYTATKDATGSTMSATVTDSVLYQTTKPSDPLTLTADTTQGNSPGP